MPMKEWFRQFHPMQIYIILVLTITLFLVELSISHITHSLTLLIDSYHTLCNILALSACVISVKYGKKPQNEDETKMVDEGTQEILSSSVCSDKARSIVTLRGKQQENKLKNTFGWARIDVVGMLACGVFLASFSFSILIQALQTLCHIDHHDEMHHAILVFGIGALSLLLNVICYVLIGGYTFQQGSFLYMTDKGCVVLESIVANDSDREDRLSRTKTIPPPQCKPRQGIREVLRDTVGCLFVMICAVLVYFTEEDVAKFIDPVMSMLSATIVMILSYPYLRESCLILLQTIPDTINIDSLKTQLVQHFPDIINVHDLHVWQLTANKVISTAHIIFQNPTVYLKITDKLTEFFQEQGITQVTIQPEFFTKTKSCESINSSKSSSMCLMQCTSEDCKSSHCCPDIQPKTLSISSKWKSLSKELCHSPSTVDLISVKVDTSELPINIEVKKEGDVAEQQTDTQASNDKEENEKCPELPSSSETEEDELPNKNEVAVTESSNSEL